jgi:hypothetical protein
MLRHKTIAFGLVVTPKRVCAGYYVATTIPDKLKSVVNGTLLMVVVLIPVPTKVIGHRTGTQSITTRLDITADDGGQPPLPAALDGRGKTLHFCFTEP